MSTTRNNSSSTTSTTPGINLGSLNRINLEGSNAGANMFIRRGTDMAGEPESCCCINIYTNSNVQGSNGSVLVGSNIEMKNPGVHLYFGDIEFGKESGIGRNRSGVSRRTGSGTLEFGNKFLFVIIPIILFVFLYSFLLQ